MKSDDAIASLGALAQESRLAIFRMLVKRGPEGYTPAAVEGTDAEKTVAFREALRALSRRIEFFLALPIPTLDRLTLSRQLREAGQLQ